jgi:(E)-4-hydroxy-3-methylbut-2-enyl-diphosphate synthase
MKSSNPQVAIQAYRLLAARMDDLGMDYPFHLGVTEAGDGEEGRIKSAVGIGSLLEDGIGDTVRVSLTEDSVYEVPVAIRLVKKFNELNQGDSRQKPAGMTARAEENGALLKLPDPFTYNRRDTIECDLVYHRIGKGHVPRVELTLRNDFKLATSNALSEIAEILGNNGNSRLTVLGRSQKDSEPKCETLHLRLKSDDEWKQVPHFRAALSERGYYLPLAIEVDLAFNFLEQAAQFGDRLVCCLAIDTSDDDLNDVIAAARRCGRPIEWRIPASIFEGEELDRAFVTDTLAEILSVCEKKDYWNIFFSLSHRPEFTAIVRPYRFLAGRLDALSANLPILLRYTSNAPWNEVLLDASAQLGSLLCDGIGDAIHIVADAPPKDLLRLSYNILQATRQRISKTEFISCPSCGRTLFNLQTTTERIKSKTSHLKGVKIAIMGCIVNGPGEMADADFGYVGAGPKKVNLFVGKECVARNIPEEIADERLIELIKSQGKWVEP